MATLKQIRELAKGHYSYYKRPPVVTKQGNTYTFRLYSTTWRNIEMRMDAARHFAETILPQRGYKTKDVVVRQGSVTRNYVYEVPYAEAEFSIVED